jgi:hypothetical protein
MPSKRVLKADFHIHSHFSADSDLSPAEILKYAKRAGLDAIAVTDHNTIEGGKAVQKIAKGIIVIVGSEIKTSEGEIIGLNLKKDVPCGLSPLKTCRLIKEQGGLVIIPHPFDRFRSGIGNAAEKIVKHIDALEVFNARTMLEKFNEDAYVFAKKHDLPCIAGSDSHFASEIGSAYTVVSSEKSKTGILKAVISGTATISGRKTGILPHWKTFVTKIGRRF